MRICWFVVKFRKELARHIVGHEMTNIFVSYDVIFDNVKNRNEKVNFPV